VAIHRPGREGDSRNHHAHILLTTRRLTAAGFTEKTRELDDLKTGEIGRWRARFAEVQNARLCEAGSEARVDHRSLEAQAIDREATIHLGPTATALERRGVPTRLGESNRAVQASHAERQRREAEARRDAERQALLRADIPALERELSEWTRRQEWLARHESPPASWLADKWGELAQAQRAATAAAQALDALEAAYADWRQVHKLGLLLMAGLPGSKRREVPAWEQRITEARTTLEQAQATLAVAQEAYNARLPAAEREARQLAEDGRRQSAALQRRIEERASLIQRAKAAQEAERERREAEAERRQREAEQRKTQEPERPSPAPKQEPPKFAIPAPQPKPRYPAPGG
jgi:MobA/MobL family.